MGRYGLILQVANNATVTGNTVQNIQLAADTASAIGLAVSSLTSSTISQNTITGIQTVVSYSPAALAASGSTGVTITQNTIDGVQVASGSSANVFGISLGTGLLNSSVTRNTIRNILYLGTGGYAGKGIDVNTGSATSGLLIANNSISNIKGDGYSTLESDAIVGIRVYGTTGGVTLYYNSVNLGSGTFAGYSTAGTSAAMYFGASTTNLDVRDNVFATNLVNSNYASAKTYAIYSAAPASAFTLLDNNDYYATGTQSVLGYIGGADKTTLAAWQAATTPRDAFSKAADPLFTSSTDLQPAIGSPLLAGGVPVSVLVDITGVTRSTTAPTIGAYELPVSADLAVSQTDSPDPVATNTNETYSVTVTNNGPYLATSPVLSVTIPAGLTFVSATAPSGWTCTAPSGGAFTCSAASMAASTNALFSIVYYVPYCAGNVVVNHNVAVASSTGDTNAGNNSSSEATTIADSGTCSDSNPCTGPDLCVGTACVPGRILRRPQRLHERHLRRRRELHVHGGRLRGQRTPAPTTCATRPTGCYHVEQHGALHDGNAMHGRHLQRRLVHQHQQHGAVRGWRPVHARRYLRRRRLHFRCRFTAVPLDRHLQHGLHQHSEQRHGDAVSVHQSP